MFISLLPFKRGQILPDPTDSFCRVEDADK